MALFLVEPLSLFSAARIDDRVDFILVCKTSRHDILVDWFCRNCVVMLVFLELVIVLLIILRFKSRMSFYLNISKT